MAEELQRVQVTERWSVEIPVAFTIVDNGDSWQAHDESQVRIVYLSSLIVADHDGPALARRVAESGDAQLRSLASSERYTLSAPGRQGAAVIATAEAGTLTGYVAKDGSLLVCLINFDLPTGKRWALETWKSLA